MRQKKTKQMMAYWLDLFRKAGNIPGSSGPFVWPDRSDVQPATCRSLLGDMFILESEDGDTRYRLAGTRLCSLYGRELKQELFSRVFSGSDQRSADTWAYQLGGEGYAVLICSMAENARGDQIPLETLMLPLSHQGQSNTRSVGITIPCKEAFWLHNEPIAVQTIRSIRVLRPWSEDNVIMREPEQPEDHDPNVMQFPKIARPKVETPSFDIGDDFLSEREIAPLLPIDQENMEHQRPRFTVIDGGKA